MQIKLNNKNVTDSVQKDSLFHFYPFFRISFRTTIFFLQKNYFLKQTLNFLNESHSQIEMLTLYLLIVITELSSNTVYSALSL